MNEQELYSAILKAFKEHDTVGFPDLLCQYTELHFGSFASKHWRQLVQAYFDPADIGPAALAIHRMSEKLVSGAVVTKVYRSPSGYLKVQVRTNGRLQTWTWVERGRWTN